MTTNSIGYLRFTACCEQSGVEPLPADEARELVRKFVALLEPALEAEFRRH